MSTVAFIFACVILGIIIISKIPGLEHFVKPLIDLLFSFLKVVFENGFAWMIFLFKTLTFSHIDLLRNLFLEAKDLDPSVVMEDRA